MVRACRNGSAVEQNAFVLCLYVFAGDAVSSLSLSLSAAMSALFACEDPATWRRVYDKYWSVAEVKKAKGKNPGKLLNLDKW